MIRNEVWTHRLYLYSVIASQLLQIRVYIHSLKQNEQFRYNLEYGHRRSEIRSGLFGSISRLTKMQYDISSVAQIIDTKHHPSTPSQNT